MDIVPYFLVDNLLTAQFLTVKQQLVGRYVHFVQKLLKSTSPEVSMVWNMVARCARSTTGRNLVNIQRETHLDPWVTCSLKIREAIWKAKIPAFAGWRFQYLGKLLDARRVWVWEPWGGQSPDWWPLPSLIPAALQGDLDTPNIPRDTYFECKLIKPFVIILWADSSKNLGLSCAKLRLKWFACWE